MNDPFTWALRLPLRDAATLSPLRTSSSIQVAVNGTELWLAGVGPTAEMDILLRQLPVIARQDVVPGNILRLPGERLSCGRLPELSWTPIAKWLQPMMPTTALPATAPGATALRLVRAAEESPCGLLLTKLATFQAYAESASCLRLERLEFAAAPDGRCLIRGTPLPALPGEHWVNHGGFATPAGFSWTPPLAAELVRRWLAIESGEIVLWHTDQTFSRITEEQWTRAERSAIRLSGEVSHV